MSKPVFVTFVGDQYKWPIAVGYQPRSEGDVCFIRKTNVEILLLTLKLIAESKEHSGYAKLAQEALREWEKS